MKQAQSAAGSSSSALDPVYLQDEARYKDARKVTLVGAAVYILLPVVKVVAGLLGSSHALIRSASEA